MKKISPLGVPYYPNIYFHIPTTNHLGFVWKWKIPRSIHWVNPTVSVSEMSPIYSRDIPMEVVLISSLKRTWSHHNPVFEKIHWIPMFLLVNPCLKVIFIIISHFIQFKCYSLHFSIHHNLNVSHYIVFFNFSIHNFPIVLFSYFPYSIKFFNCFPLNDKCPPFTPRFSHRFPFLAASASMVLGRSNALLVLVQCGLPVRRGASPKGEHCGL